MVAVDVPLDVVPCQYKVPPVPPLAVTVIVPPHCEVADGVAVTAVGNAFTVNALPEPVADTQLPLLTTILPAPLAPAGNVTVAEVAEEYVNVAAVPFIVAVEVAVKLFPVSVITCPLPAHALVGDTTVTVGVVQVT